MSVIVGNHPVPMTVILVQGSSASLVVPSDTGVMSAPVLEFAAENSAATPLASHTLTLESGEWVVHLSAAQITALKTARVARVKDGTRTVAAGAVDPNAGWEGRSLKSTVKTQIIFGGGTGGGGATTLDGLSDVDTTGGVTGHVLTQQADGTWGPATPPAAGDASETVKGIVELATTVEATTGTDTVRAVTPAALKAVADAELDAFNTEMGAV